jgi:hypothetical protein
VFNNCVNYIEILRNDYTLSQYSTGVTSPAAAGYLQAAGYYTMPTTAAQLQQSAALYAAQPTVSQQSATAAAAGADGRLQ